jgi:polyisoprenoid-binding protein YceI
MKKLLVATGFILIAFLGSLKAQATHTSITFEIKNVGITTGGSIGGLQTRVHFDPSNLNASTLEASVDVNTINSDNSSRDEHLRSEDFFDVAHFAKISLKSVSFKHKSGDNYTGRFMLTMKGRSKQVDIPFAFLDKDNTLTFKGSFKLNRLDFGVGSKSMILSDEVTVNIDCQEKKQELTQL